LRYTPSASGHLSESAQVILTKRLLPDSEARCATLFEKCGLNRVAANLGLAVIEDPAKAKEQPAPEPAPAPQLAAPEAAERLEKARSGEADPSRSKPFPLPGLAGAWLELAGFG
jgi:hypothetical protein